jgi:hypothetical protein
VAFRLEVYRKHCVSPESQFYTTLACYKSQFVSSFGNARIVDGAASLTAYNLSRRTREIGIRIALGAASPDMLRL